MVDGNEITRAIGLWAAGKGGIVAFFRGRQPETSVWRRFRSGLDGFTFVKEAEHYAAHIVTHAERAVDLFHVLMEQLPPAVDLAIDDRRGRRSWTGDQIALPDAQDAIGRLKVALAAAGGVEIAIYTADDQITLNSQLELFILRAKRSVALSPAWVGPGRADRRRNPELEAAAL